MASFHQNLTVDQLLNDPVTLAVMRADRIDPASFRAMLAGQARRLREAEAAADALPAGCRFLPAPSPLDSLRAF